MNISYPISKKLNLSNAWLFVAACAILTLPIAVSPWQMAAHAQGIMQVSHRSVMSPAPQALPVPVPPQSHVVDVGGYRTAQMSVTPVPANVHPVPQPVATPPGIYVLP